MANFTRAWKKAEVILSFLPTFFVWILLKYELGFLIININNNIMIRFLNSISVDTLGKNQPRQYQQQVTFSWFSNFELIWSSVTNCPWLHRKALISGHTWLITAHTYLRTYVKDKGT